MLKNLTTFLHNRLFTKCISLLFGYSLWFCVAQYQTVSQSYQIPICFYDINNKNICSIENVTIQIQGQRKDIYQFNPQHTALHLNGSNFKEGKQDILLSKENLFLPDTVKLIDLIPSYLSIDVNPTEKL